MPTNLINNRHTTIINNNKLIYLAVLTDIAVSWGVFRTCEAQSSYVTGGDLVFGVGKGEEWVIIGLWENIVVSECVKQRNPTQEQQIWEIQPHTRWWNQKTVKLSWRSYMGRLIRYIISVFYGICFNSFTLWTVVKLVKVVSYKGIHVCMYISSDLIRPV